MFLLSAQSNLYFSHGWLARHKTSGNIYLSKLQQVSPQTRRAKDAPAFMLCCVYLQTRGFVSPTGSRRLIDLRSVFVRFLRALPCHFRVCCRRAGQPWMLLISPRSSTAAVPTLYRLSSSLEAGAASLFLNSWITRRSAAFLIHWGGQRCSHFLMLPMNHNWLTVSCFNHRCFGSEGFHIYIQPHNPV